MEVRVQGHPTLQGQHVIVPGDPTLATLFLVAGTLVPRSEIRIQRMSLNPTRRGAVEALRRMGAAIEVEDQEESAGELLGDVTVRSAELNRIRMAGSMTARLLNELPILAVAATQAKGEVVVRDAQELRSFRVGEETDRLGAIVENLRTMGAKVGEMPDGFIIEGGRPLVGTRVHSGGDPWITMALAVAGLIAEGETILEDVECTDHVFPEFYQQLNALRRT